MFFKSLATFSLFSLVCGIQHLKAGTLGDLTYEITGETVTITEIAYLANGAVVIPSHIESKPVTTIGANACYSRSYVTSVTLPSSVTKIDTNAFFVCRKLATCNLPEGIQEIGDGAFQSCGSLTQVTLPSTAFRLGKNLFSECRKLQSVTLPENLTAIPDGMFSYCQNLRTLRIPPQVKSIGNSSFQYSGLKKVVLPASVNSIGASAFDSSSDLNQVVFQGGLSRIESSTFAHCSSLSQVKLPANVTYIGDSAFIGTAIPRVNLESIGTIGLQAFSGCTRLVTVSFPKKLKALDSEAFSNCGNLASAVFAGDAPQMGKQVFAASAPEFKILLSEKSRGFTLTRWKGYKTSLPAAEIHIQSSDGAILENGSDARFGGFVIGAKSQIKMFTITNVGNLPLTEISADLSGGDSADYRITLPLKTRLAPGMNTQIGLRFAPKEPGKSKSPLRISSSDTNENPFLIMLSGRGIRLLE